MRPGNSKTLASSERGGLDKVLSRLRRVEDVRPTQWWKRLPQQVASRVSAVRTKRDRPGTKSRSGASPRCTAALAALGSRPRVQSRWPCAGAAQRKYCPPCRCQRGPPPLTRGQKPPPETEIAACPRRFPARTPG